MYTVLNSGFQVKGSLTLNNGRGGTAFFADTITQQIATDDSNNLNTLLSNSFNDYDKQGNTKQWNHTLTLSVEATNLGTSITTSDYIMYFDEVAKKYYMMKVIDTATDRNSGFIKVDCINTAIYELGKQLVVEEKTFKNATLSQVVESVYKNAPFSIVIQDDLTISIDYTISANTSLQSVIQDIQTKYNVDVDSWITLDNDGQIGERVLYFGHLGSDNGELIRYGGGKGFENINAQELSDIIYTKVYITGVASDTDTKKGHIGSVNNGLEYIVDDDANQRMYTVGASQQQPVYLEGQLTNNILSEPSALLDWGKQQLALFNHPRFNYTVTPLHDEIVGIGDSITVQDFHIQPMILVTSKVIQKSTSFASPETNTFVLGEFSSIFSDRASKNNMVIEVIKKDVTVVQAAADIAKAQADEAHRQAILAQEQAIHAQTSADGKTTTYTVDSVQDLPDNVIEGAIGWVKLSDGTHMYSYIDGKWVEKINPSMGADINKKVSDAVTQAKEHTATAIEQNNASQQEMMDDIAKSQADLAIKDADFINKAQDMADKALSDAKANTAMVASKSLGTYLVRLLPGTNIFKTTNSTTIQAQVWKAGQDITSTLDNASFSWKLAKDGANAIGLTNNVKNITAKPSDFTNTGTYIVNVIIPVTDTTGTTRNQTFSDSTTIAKVSDGVNGATGNGISSTTITYAVSASGTNAPTSGYTSTIPTVNKGQFLWQRTATSYTNGTTKNSDVVTYFAKDGLNGVAGMDGGQGMIAQPSKPTSGLVDGFLWLDTSQTYPVYYVYDSSIKDFKIYQFNAKNINADQIKAKFVGTDRLSASQIIADDLRVKSANIDGQLTASQITVSSTNGSQTSLANFNLGEMSQTISDTKNEVNSLGQINQLFNTEFNPDLQGWKLTADSGSNTPYKSGFDKNVQANMVGFNTTNAPASSFAILQQDVLMGHASGGFVSLSWQAWAPTFANYANLWVRFYDNNNTQLDATSRQWTPQKSDGSIVDGLWTRQKAEGIALPVNTTRINISFQTREGINAYLVRPMLVFDATIGAYVAGAYNNNAALAQVKITADGVSSIVSNPTTGLSTRVQTAEGTLSKVQGIDIPALQNATFWQAPNGYDLNTYLTQGSTFFRDTTARTNAPTTSTKWMYLVVERTPNGDRVTQTAWYDTLTDAKITYRRQYADTWGAWYANDNDSVTTITQTNGNVTREIENRKTGDNNTLQSSKDFTQSTLTSYDSGLQSQLTQTSSAFLATISSTNLVIDSSLTDSAFSGSIVNWIPSGAGKWYYSSGVSYQGVQSMGYNQSSLNGDYSFVDSQPWGVNSFSGSTLNVSVDVRANNIGGTSTDYLIVILMEQDNNGNQTQRTDITRTISKTNNNWVNYRNKITINPNSKKFFIRYQMRGNGNVYVARPYVGVQELIAGGYTAGTNNNNKTILSLFKDNWSIGITDNIGAITSGIVGNSSSMSLISKNIVLDGNTTVTGDFYAKGGNFTNLNASNIKVGTLDGYQVNIANVNVNNLVGDTITGFNFNVNKQMTIASGGIIQSDVIHMDKTSFGVSAPNVGVQRYSPQGYNVTVFGTFNISSILGNISTNGSIQVTKPGDTTPYKKGDSYSTYGVNNMYIRTLNYDNKDPNEHLNIASAEIDIITGGTSGLLSDSTNATQISSRYVTTTGSVTAGSAVNTGTVYSGNGNLWLNSANASTVLQGGGTSILQARENGYMYYLTRKTGSGGSSLQVAGDGGMFVQSSATKFKEDIQYDGGTSVGDKFLTLDPATWQDKFEYKQREQYRKNGIEPSRQIYMNDRRYYGLIAEDLVKAGLEEFIVRDEVTGEVNGLEYDKVAISLIPVVREQRDAINELRLEVERLKQK